jgi:trehalose/maltose transport system substrate-binding protein
VSRPSKVTGQKYNRVSEEFWNTVHTTLSGKGDAKANLKKLEKKLMRISRNGNW